MDSTGQGEKKKIKTKQAGELQVRMRPKLESVSAQSHDVLMNDKYCSLAKDRGTKFLFSS